MHFTTLLYDPILCIENTKGSTSGVDHDSGLGTSRYKSTMSYTMSDVRTLWLLFLPKMFMYTIIGNNGNAGGL